MSHSFEFHIHSTFTHWSKEICLFLYFERKVFIFFTIYSAIKQSSAMSETKSIPGRIGSQEAWTCYAVVLMTGGWWKIKPLFVIVLLPYIVHKTMKVGDSFSTWIIWLINYWNKSWKTLILLSFMKFESGLCIAFVDQTYPEILASTNNSKICISSSRHKSLETCIFCGFYL